jgi:hypothetical protein
LTHYRSLNVFIDQAHGDPRDIHDGLVDVADAATKLSTALAKLPKGGWNLLWTLAPNEYVKFADSPVHGPMANPALPEELLDIAHVAHVHAEELQAARRATVYLESPDVTQHAYTRDHLVRDIAVAYRRHFGKPTFWVNGKESEPISQSRFIAIVRSVLSTAGLEPITRKLVRKIVGELGS